MQVKTALTSSCDISDVSIDPQQRATAAIFRPPPIGSAEYCDERVCLTVCLCASLSVHDHFSENVRSSRNFLCMLPVARSSSGITLRISGFVDDVIPAVRRRR